jgi:GTPase SAR1 family protein
MNQATSIVDNSSNSRDSNSPPYSTQLMNKDHFHLGITGQSGSGKSAWLKEFLRDKNNANALVLCSDKSILDWYDNKEQIPCIKLVTSEPSGILPYIKMLERHKNKNRLTPLQMPTTFIIFDDFMPTLRHMGGGLQVQFEELCKIGRHIGIRIIGLTQDAKDFPKYMRTQFTHVGIMKGTDGETFDQLIELMKLQENNKSLWNTLKKTDDHTMMVLEKGNECPSCEKYDSSSNKIVNTTTIKEVKIVGDNNTVTQSVLNLNGQASYDQRKQEIVDNRRLLIEKKKNTHLEKAIDCVDLIHNVVSGVFIDKKHMEKCKNNTVFLSNYLRMHIPPLTVSNWIDQAGNMLIAWKAEEIMLESYPVATKKEKLLEYSKLVKATVTHRKKNYVNDKIASHLVSGHADKALINTIAKKTGVRKLAGVDIDEAYEYGKEILPLLAYVKQLVR